MLYDFMFGVFLKIFDDVLDSNISKNIKLYVSISFLLSSIYLLYIKNVINILYVQILYGLGVIPDFFFYKGKLANLDSLFWYIFIFSGIFKLFNIKYNTKFCVSILYQLVFWSILGFSDYFFFDSQTNPSHKIIFRSTLLFILLCIFYYFKNNDLLLFFGYLITSILSLVFSFYDINKFIHYIFQYTQLTI